MDIYIQTALTDVPADARAQGVWGKTGTSVLSIALVFVVCARGEGEQQRGLSAGVTLGRNKESERGRSE